MTPRSGDVARAKRLFSSTASSPPRQMRVRFARKSLYLRKHALLLPAAEAGPEQKPPLFCFPLYCSSPHSARSLAPSVCLASPPTSMLSHFGTILSCALAFVAGTSVASAATGTSASRDAYLLRTKHDGSG